MKKSALVLLCILAISCAALASEFITKPVQAQVPYYTTQTFSALSMDGCINKSGTNFAVVQAASSGTVSNTSSVIWCGDNYSSSSPHYHIARAFEFFNVTPMTGYSIMSIIFSIDIASAAQKAFNITIQHSSSDDTYPHRPIISTDFFYGYMVGNSSNSYYGNDGYASSGTSTGWKNITLTSWLHIYTNGSLTKIVLRDMNDINSVTPTSGNSETIQYYGSLKGSSYAPKLYVTYRKNQLIQRVQGCYISSGGVEPSYAATVIQLNSTPVSGDVEVATMGIVTQSAAYTVNNVTQIGVGWTKIKSVDWYNSSDATSTDCEIWWGTVGANASKVIIVTGTPKTTMAIFVSVCEYSAPSGDTFRVDTIITGATYGYGKTLSDISVAPPSSYQYEVWVGAIMIYGHGPQTLNTTGWALFGVQKLVYLEKIVNSTSSSVQCKTTVSTATEYAGCQAGFGVIVTPSTKQLIMNSPTGGYTYPQSGITYTLPTNWNVSMSAFPYEGYSFSHWNINGSSYTQNPITITLSKTYSITAVFSALSSLSSYWVQCPPPPLYAGTYVGEVEINNTIYCFGGRDAQNRYPFMQSYNVTSGKWTILKCFPSWIDNPGNSVGSGFDAMFYGVANNIIYIFGGYPTQTDVFAYYPKNNSYSKQLASMPFGGGWDGDCITVTNSTTGQQVIFCIGGSTDHNQEPWCNVYNPSTNTWSAKANMTYARAKFGVAYYRGRIYVFGGSWYTPTNTAEYYNISANTWRTVANLPYSQGYAVLNPYVVNGTIYLYNQGNGTSYSRTEVIAYNSITNTYSANITAMNPPVVNSSSCSQVYNYPYVYGSPTYAYAPSNVSCSSYQLTQVTVGNITETYAIGTDANGKIVNCYFKLPATYITIASYPVNGSGYVIVDGQAITTPKTFIWASSTIHNLTAISIVTVAAQQERLLYLNWSDGGARSHNYTTPGSSATVTANFYVQWNITITSSGIGSDSSGTVATLNGTSFTQSQLTTPSAHSQWLNASGSCSYSFSSPVSSSSTKRYVWSSTSGLSQTLQTHSFTVTTYGTITGTYLTQYQVTFTQTGISNDYTGTIITVNGSAEAYGNPLYSVWCISGTSLSYSYNSPCVVTSNQKQYIWSTTSGLSQTLQANSFSVTSGGTITATYTTQYYFSVSSQYDTATPSSGWFNSGTAITETVTSPVSGGTGIQYVCTGWTGTGSCPPSGSGTSTGSFTITVYSTCTWNWVTQYNITVTSSNIGSDSSGTVVTINGNAEPQSSLPFSIWITSGSSCTYAFSSPVTVNSTKQYVWNITSGLGQTLMGNTFTVTTYGTITGTYLIQYKIIFAQNGISSDYTETIVTVNGTAKTYSQLPYSPWYTSGVWCTYAYTSPYVVTSNQKQYIWSSTSGLEPLQATTFNVTTAGTINATYLTQYYFLVSSAYDTPTGTGWYTAGTSCGGSTVTRPVSGGTGIQYETTGWTGTGSLNSGGSSGSSSTGSFTINAYSTCTWNWKTQYSITITSSGIGSDSSGTVATLNGNAETQAQLPYSQWCDSGSSCSYSFTSPVVATSTKKYVWSSTSGLSQTLESNTFTVTQNGTITGTYVIAPHYVTVTNVTSSKTIVGKGYSVKINVTAANSGDYTETFNVTAYANTTAIATQNITLLSGNSGAITLVWKTTGFAYGQYTIKIEVALSSGETNMANNNYTGGSILVSIPGDVNGDHKVTALDIALIGIALFTKPGNPLWNPNCDIAGTGKVSAIDIVIAGLYLFESW